MKNLIIIGLLLCFAMPASGQAPKYSNEFLSIGVGARAMGLGNAVVATVDNATAGFWNPAGMVHFDKDFQVAVMHSEYFAGIAKYDYGSVTIPLPRDTKVKRSIGFSLIRFGVDDIPYTLHLVDPNGNINYDNVTSFSAADYAFYFSYAQDLAFKDLQGLKIGGNAKVVHRSAGQFASAWGFGLDIGLQMDHKNWRFGLMGKDITTTFNAWSFNFTEEEKAIFEATNNEIPESSLEITLPKLILAAGYYHEFSDKFSMMPELDLDLTTDGKRNVLISAKPFSIDPHFGVEFGYSRFIFLRGGFQNIQKALDDLDGTKEIWTLQPNIGLGLVLGELSIDYAFTDIGNASQALYSHVFSLMLDFDKEGRRIKRHR